MRPEKSFDKPFESGRASLEFLVLSITLFVPILYLGLSLASLQGASLATEAAARNAVRVYVQGASSPNPERRVEVAALLALSNHGLTARKYWKHSALLLRVEVLEDGSWSGWVSRHHCFPPVLFLGHGAKGPGWWCRKPLVWCQPMAVSGERKRKHAAPFWRSGSPLSCHHFGDKRRHLAVD